MFTLEFPYDIRERVWVKFGKEEVAAKVIGYRIDSSGGLLIHTSVGWAYEEEVTPLDEARKG